MLIDPVPLKLRLVDSNDEEIDPASVEGVDLFARIVRVRVEQVFDEQCNFDGHEAVLTLEAIQ